MINEASKMTATIRHAVKEDADGITRTFLESAEHHAGLDSDLYFVPAAETIAALTKKDDSIRRRNAQKASRLSQSSVVKLLDS
jgi:hypothetical protein